MTEHPFLPGDAVAAYCRASPGNTQDQSVAKQEALIREFCQGQGLSLARVFTDDARSGGSLAGRDAFQAMVEWFEQRPPVSGLVVWELSRLSREYDVSQFYLATIRRLGYKIHSLGDAIPAGAVGRVVESLYIWSAEEERTRLTARIRGGVEYSRRVHGRYSNKAPVGYKFERVDVGKRRDGTAHVISRLVVDEDKAPLVRIAFEMRAAGHTAPEIHAATHLMKNYRDYHRFFQRQVYTGRQEVGGEVLANLPAIIDDELFSRVQAVYGTHLHPRRAASFYLLSGLAHCAVCKRMLSGHTCRGTYRYYTCSTCKVSIRAEVLDNQVVDAIERTLFRPGALALWYDVAREAEVGRLADQQQHALALQQTLADVERKMQRVVAAIVDAGHNRVLLDSLADLERQQAELRLAVSAAAAAPGSALPPLADLDQLLHLGVAALRQGGRDAQLVVRQLVDRVEVDRDKRGWVWVVPGPGMGEQLTAFGG